MLGKIVSCIGKLCHTDKLTEYVERGDPDRRISYARVLVELDASVELRDEITLRGQNGKEGKQHIIYDWRPWQCLTCRKFGHKEGDCHSHEQRKKVWMPKDRHQNRPMENANSRQNTTKNAAVVTNSTSPPTTEEQLAQRDSIMATEQSNQTVTPRKTTKTKEGKGIHSSGGTKSQGTWQKVVGHRAGKEPLLVNDPVMEANCSQAVVVTQITGSLERDRMVIQHPVIPNG